MPLQGRPSRLIRSRRPLSDRPQCRGRPQLQPPLRWTPSANCWGPVQVLPVIDCPQRSCRPAVSSCHASFMPPADNAMRTVDAKDSISVQAQHLAYACVQVCTICSAHAAQHSSRTGGRQSGCRSKRTCTGRTLSFSCGAASQDPFGSFASGEPLSARPAAPPHTVSSPECQMRASGAVTTMLPTDPTPPHATLKPARFGPTCTLIRSRTVLSSDLTKTVPQAKLQSYCLVCWQGCTPVCVAVTDARAVLDGRGGGAGAGFRDGDCTREGRVGSGGPLCS